jgi:hypothetical protein
MAAEIIAVVEIIIKVVVGTDMAAPDHVGTLIRTQCLKQADLLDQFPTSQY